MNRRRNVTSPAPAPPNWTAPPPGDGPQPSAVYVDETDAVWVSDWGANAILRFDPRTEKFESFPLPDRYASVRQLAGRKGEVWGAESGADKLFVIKGE